MQHRVGVADCQLLWRNNAVRLYFGVVCRYVSIFNKL